MQKCPDLLLGVGTIKNLQQAEDYMTAGADFLVSPVLYQKWLAMQSAMIFFMHPVV